MNIELIYSEERGTWNVFIGAEWYYESDSYDDAVEVYDRLWATDYLVN